MTVEAHRFLMQGCNFEHSFTSWFIIFSSIFSLWLDTQTQRGDEVSYTSEPMTRRSKVQMLVQKGSMLQYRYYLKSVSCLLHKYVTKYRNLLNLIEINLHICRLFIVCGLIAPLSLTNLIWFQWLVVLCCHHFVWKDVMSIQLQEYTL